LDKVSKKTKVFVFEYNLENRQW